MKDIIQLKSFSAKLNNILIRDHSGFRSLKASENWNCKIIVSFTDADFVRGGKQRKNKTDEVPAREWY